MDIIIIQGLIAIGGISFIALIIARYSIQMMFHTMQFILAKMQNRKQK